MPRFILFVRASENSEVKFIPSQELFQAMSQYNDALLEAGVFIAGEGLLPSARVGQRVVFHDDDRGPTIESGPFPMNELVSGWWILTVKDVEEATAWAKKCPMMKEGDVLEIRKISEADDFGSAMTQEMREKEEAMRMESEKLEKGGQN
ncbi:hypothetical protein BJ875DRAFT_540464 [Amylocarpus encephaloides]|uniref:YCII-related domain-containing protein n=1 Tax=Amylocarpus encephaloides TaxID=45428 RepID=A0A9P7YPR6_9HELO|nr:hypothetical protein BJ875DRAFT_540464 [Amylocarpus encephaloides]